MDVLLVTFFVGFVLALLIIVPRLRKSDPGSSRLSNSAGDKASKVYSKAEVSLHNRRTDCWIIIKEKVYDVTSYVEEHPGGDAILTHAGDDSTKGFYGLAKFLEQQLINPFHILTGHSMLLESLT
ncbi:cytochrome B5-like protein isoform X2 [Primulina tabacum]|uniref:cytochrome B5-like protein isoform X2 n=1 Tax=Primulina tabacum TaxID=48773 RepID=UPI003F593B04